MLDCVVDYISLENVQLPFLEAMWYGEPQSYGVTEVASQIIQEPACGYSYFYAAYVTVEGDENL